MKYYRLAIQNQHTALWTWKSTVVTSLQAVFQLLRIYQALPQDRLRVFASASKEELAQTRLESEQHSLTVCSVTAVEFARTRKLQTGEAVRSSSDRETGETATQPLSTVATLLSLQLKGMVPSSLAAASLNNFDKQRLEREMGPGGDHDLLYTFMLPATLAETRVWVRLLAQVQRGELQP